jgi:hypothetical protein
MLLTASGLTVTAMLFVLLCDSHNHSVFSEHAFNLLKDLLFKDDPSSHPMLHLQP